MRKRRAVVRFAAWVAGVAGVLTCTGVTVLAHPDPLFAYHVTYGRLELRSDAPFDFAAGQSVLADVERRLDQSELNDRGSHRAIIANAAWRRELTFLWNGGAAGLNYYPLTRNVFIRRSDIEADRVFGASGKMAQPPRTLAYYIAHEIGHTLTKERVGEAEFFSMPRWLREGVADYIGFGSRVDVDELMKALRAGDPTLDPRSGYYARYRLLVAALLQREHWPMDKLLHSKLSEQEAEKIVLSKGGIKRD